MHGQHELPEGDATSMTNRPLTVLGVPGFPNKTGSLANDFASQADRSKALQILYMPKHL